MWVRAGCDEKTRWRRVARCVDAYLRGKVSSGTEERPRDVCPPQHRGETKIDQLDRRNTSLSVHWGFLELNDDIFSLKRQKFK